MTGTATAALGTFSPLAAGSFLAFVGITLAIAIRARKGSGTAAGFYAAHGSIGPLRNALALAGDFISAAAFLGVSGLIFGAGHDGIFFAVGGFAGWPVLLILVAERLRRLGRYTFADVLALRLHEPAVRLASALTSLSIVILYLVGQLVAAGALIATLFGIPYAAALLLMGALTAGYVVIGGMAATTWVQIIKAVLLIAATLVLAALALAQFGLSPARLFASAAAASPSGNRVFLPGPALSDPVATLSLGLALVFGTCGLPHVLMRFFTVADAGAARTSVAIATGIIGIFSMLTILLGYAAVALLSGSGPLPGGGNMVMLHLARWLGGDLVYGLVAAITFATILAVVAGLTLAGAAAISHDLYAGVFKRGATDRDEVRVSRAAVIGIAALGVGLGLVFAGQNIAFIVSLAVSIAAAVNFPILMLALYWPGFTTRGLVVATGLGLSASLALVTLASAVWSKALGLGPAPFPYDYPTLFVMPVTFVAAFLASVSDRSPRGIAERAGFRAMRA